MFAQVMRGRTSNPEGLRAAMDRWMVDLRPGAVGWLGSTAGVTDDGMAVAVARFESAEAAGRNSRRPEQTAWWEAMEGLSIIAAEARPPIRGLAEVLLGAVKDREARVRVFAARGLWRRTREERVVVPLLREAVTDRDVLVRQTARTSGISGLALAPEPPRCQTTVIVESFGLPWNEPIRKLSVV